MGLIQTGNNLEKKYNFTFFIDNLEGEFRKRFTETELHDEVPKNCNNNILFDYLKIHKIFFVLYKRKNFYFYKESCILVITMFVFIRILINYINQLKYYFIYII